MCLTESEHLIIDELYNYNRIPIWILDEHLTLLTSYFPDLPLVLKTKLLTEFKKEIRNIKTPDFEVLNFENELYFFFPFERSNRTFYLLGGPMLLSHIHRITELRTLSFSGDLQIKELQCLVERLPIVSSITFSSSLRIMMLLLRKNAPTIDKLLHHKLSNLHGLLNRLYIYELFDNKESYKIHTPYREELTLLNCVKEGDVARLEAIYRTLPQIKYGHMSSNPLKQLFYGCIANTTLVTRYAIEGGLEEEAAFTLSDTYIKQMENCRTCHELNLINEKMALDFTERVSSTKNMKQPKYSKTINQCIDYISNNIYSKLTLAMLAKEVNLTPKYLSFLFQKETTQKITTFIMDKKIQEAQSLLRYSNYPYSHISEHLSFYSQSHFIATFKKKIGITPRMYREGILKL